MPAIVHYNLPPAPRSPLLCACGSPEWIAVLPGNEPPPPSPSDRIVPLHPDPVIAMQVACASCWPWWRADAAALPLSEKR